MSESYSTLAWIYQSSYLLMHHHAMQQFILRQLNIVDNRTRLDNVMASLREEQLHFRVKDVDYKVDSSIITMHMISDDQTPYYQRLLIPLYFYHISYAQFLN